MDSETRSAKKEGNHWPGLSAPPPVSVEEACQLHERAVALREYGQLAEATTCAQHALTSLSACAGQTIQTWPTSSTIWRAFAQTRVITPRPHDCPERAVAIMEQATGSPDLEMLRIQSLRTLAGVYRAQGCYAEAESLYQRALAGAEAMLGLNHLETAACLNDLAVLYKSLGKYAEAEGLYQRALPLFEQALGPSHPHVETCLRNYARLLRDTQRWAKARIFETRARQARHSRRASM